MLKILKRLTLKWKKNRSIKRELKEYSCNLIPLCSFEYRKSIAIVTQQTIIVTVQQQKKYSIEQNYVNQQLRIIENYFVHHCQS